MEDKQRDKLIKKFPYVVAWSRMMGSFGYYIDAQLEKAEATNAPEDAIFYSDETNGWRRYIDCRESLKYDLDGYKNGTKGGAVVGWGKLKID